MVINKIFICYSNQHSDIIYTMTIFLYFSPACTRVSFCTYLFVNMCVLLGVCLSIFVFVRILLSLGYSHLSHFLLSIGGIFEYFVTNYFFSSFPFSPSRVVSKLVEFLFLVLAFPQNKILFLEASGVAVLDLSIKMHKKNTALIGRINSLLSQLI